MPFLYRRKTQIPTSRNFESPNNESLEKLFATEDTSTLINIAQFVNIIMEIFERQDECDREEL